MPKIRYLSNEARGFTYESLANAKNKRDPAGDTGPAQPPFNPNTFTTDIVYVGSQEILNDTNLLKVEKWRVIRNDQTGEFTNELLWTRSFPDIDFSSTLLERNALVTMFGERIFTVITSDKAVEIYELSPSNGNFLQQEVIFSSPIGTQDTMAFVAEIDSNGRLWYGRKGNSNALVRHNDLDNLGNLTLISPTLGEGRVDTRWGVNTNRQLIVGNNTHYTIYDSGLKELYSNEWQLSLGGSQPQDLAMGRDGFYAGVSNSINYINFEGFRLWRQDTSGPVDYIREYPGEFVFHMQKGGVGTIAVKRQIETGNVIDYWVVGSDNIFGADPMAAVTIKFPGINDRLVLSSHRSNSKPLSNLDAGKVLKSSTVNMSRPRSFGVALRANYKLHV